MTERERIGTAIDGIAAALKRPGLTDLERRLLHEDRKDLRAQLAALPPEPRHDDPTRHVSPERYTPAQRRDLRDAGRRFE